MTTATNQVFQSIYIDPYCEKQEHKIVFHTPLFQKEPHSITVLKTLRLEKYPGLVVSGPKAAIRVLIKTIEEQDTNGDLGKDLQRFMEIMVEETGKLGLSIVYTQGIDLVETVNNAHASVSKYIKQITDEWNKIGATYGGLEAENINVEVCGDKHLITIGYHKSINTRLCTQTDLIKLAINSGFKRTIGNRFEKVVHGSTVVINATPNEVFINEVFEIDRQLIDVHSLIVTGGLWLKKLK